MFTSKHPQFTELSKDTCWNKTCTNGKKRGEKGCWPFTMTLMTRRSISPRAIRRASHVYKPSSVFFIPWIWRWLLLSILKRTERMRRRKIFIRHLYLQNVQHETFFFLTGRSKCRNNCGLWCVSIHNMIWWILLNKRSRLSNGL